MNIPSTSNMSRDIGYLPISCPLFKAKRSLLTKNIDTHGHRSKAVQRPDVPSLRAPKPPYKRRRLALLYRTAYVPPLPIWIVTYSPPNIFLSIEILPVSQHQQTHSFHVTTRKASIRISFRSAKCSPLPPSLIPGDDSHTFIPLFGS